MSGLTGVSLNVSGSSVLAGGANITGTTNTNNLNVINNSNITQTGTGTFSSGTGNFLINGPITATNTSSFTNQVVLNSSGSLKTPKNTIINSVNDIVDTTNTQTISGVKTFSGLLTANNGITTNNINSVNASYYDPTSSIQGQFNTTSTNISSANSNIANLQTKTTNQTYTTGNTSFGSNNITTTGVINANGGISTNNQNINAGSGTIQGGSIKSQVNSGTYTGVNSYFFTNGDVYGTTYFDNPQANSSINFRIGSSLPTYATINTSGLSVVGTITSNNNNINAGTGTMSCGTLVVGSGGETDAGSLNITGLLTNGSYSNNLGSPTLSTLLLQNSIYTANNLIQLQTYGYRFATAGDWQTQSTRIHSKVDTTFQGMLEFNNPSSSVALRASNGSGITVSGTGATTVDLLLTCNTGLTSTGLITANGGISTSNNIQGVIVLLLG